MVHSPSSYAHDLWQQCSQNGSDRTVELSCLMPNGVFIPLIVNINATINEVKEDLWEEASRFPLHGTLHDASKYVFSCINSMAETEELLDENKRLCDVRPFVAVLKIIERMGDKAEKKINAQISHLIGKGLHEFDSLKNPEVNYFRSKMKSLADEMAYNRQSKSWLEQLRYHHPPQIAVSDTLPEAVTVRLGDDKFKLTVKSTACENTETAFTFSVKHTKKPVELIEMILAKRKAITPNKNLEDASDFVLKVCGQEEYLVGDYPLSRFNYIREAISRDVVPTLVTVYKSSLRTESEYQCVESEELRRTRSSFSTMTLRKKGKYISAWDIHDRFTFRVCAMSRLNCDTARNVEVGVQAGLFHGIKSLCASQKTSEKVVSKDGNVEWEEDLSFDIKVCDIPRMARLCFVFYEITRSSKGFKSILLKDYKQVFLNPMGWVNTTVYDFKNQLKTGAMTLYMWTYAEDTQTDGLLRPLGTVVSNPNVDHATLLTITFHKYHAEHTVAYPPMSKVIEYAEKEDSIESLKGKKSPSGNFFDIVKTMAECDPLHEIHEQDLKSFWMYRHELVKTVPRLLPRLLNSVEWNDHREVAQAINIVKQWEPLPPEKALELLDYAYADQTVRTFAVECLNLIPDEELSLYLLQLVQAVKHESYLDCDLVVFLLKRALNNQKIGHFLFWHLRSEMHVPSVSVRFGLILEAYCRGALEHMRTLERQMALLERLKTTSEQVRKNKDKDKARHVLHEILSDIHCQEILSSVHSPLEPSFKLNRIRTEKCKVMDSKMKPLWMVFENDDVYGDDIYLIFKNGDDLRQDMLTLQMIRIMDQLWKDEGLDLRMNPYGCISTDNRVGLIEVVLNAETIANIQKEKGTLAATSAFQKGSIFSWLKEHNPTESSMNKAIEEFTYSCAGYCVATYVLGVADRHSDNIMVKRTGQLFHIDFGHILGHFKEKFGFKRERVPFVLTHDLVHVINKGQTKKQALEFQIFQKTCEQAFLILRRHGCLILSLFAMMISTGLPELSSEKDLNYLRDTLVLDLTDNDALSHFRAKFDEALSNSWKASLNWTSHNMTKNNKQ